MLNVKNLKNRLFVGFSILGLLGVFYTTTAGVVFAQNVKSNTDVHVSVCYPTVYPAPTISSPGDGTKTKESSILVMGEATPDIPVFVYLNDVEVAQVFADGDGVYVASVGLSEGDNAIKTSTNNDCHPPAFSDTVTVEYKVPKTPPGKPGTPPQEQSPDSGDFTQDELLSPLTLPPRQDDPTTADTPGGSGQKEGWPVIESPLTNSTVSTGSVLVVGYAPPNTVVSIFRGDDKMARVTSGSDGRFAARIPLLEGKNSLRAKIGSGANAKESNMVIITYKPAPSTLSGFSFPSATMIAILLTIAILGLTGYALFGGMGPFAHVAHDVSDNIHKRVFRRFKWH